MPFDRELRATISMLELRFEGGFSYFRWPDGDRLHLLRWDDNILVTNCDQEVQPGDVLRGVMRDEPYPDRICWTCMTRRADQVSRKR